MSARQSWVTLLGSEKWVLGRGHWARQKRRDRLLADLEAVAA